MKVFTLPLFSGLPAAWDRPGTDSIGAETSARKAPPIGIDLADCDVIRKSCAEFVHGEGCDWEALTQPVAP